MKIADKLAELHERTEKIVGEITFNWRRFQDDEELARVSLAWFTTGGNPADFTPPFLAFLCDQLTSHLIEFKEWDEMTPEQRNHFVFRFVIDPNRDEFHSAILATARDIALSSLISDNIEEGLWLYPWHACLSNCEGGDLERVAMLHKVVFNLLAQGAVLTGKTEAFRDLNCILKESGSDKVPEILTTLQLAWDVAVVATRLKDRTGERQGKDFVKAIVRTLFYNGTDGPSPRFWRDAMGASPDLFLPPRSGKRLDKTEKTKAVEKAVKDLKKFFS